MTINRIIELLSEFQPHQRETDVCAVFVNGDANEEAVRLFPGTNEGGDGEPFALIEGAFYQEEAGGVRVASRP